MTPLKILNNSKCLFVINGLWILWIYGFYLRFHSFFVKIPQIYEHLLYRCFNFWSVAFVIILHLTYFFLSMSFLWSLKFCSRTHHDFYIPFQLYFWTLCFLNIFLMNINSFATYECCYPCLLNIFFHFHFYSFFFLLVYLS